MSAPGGCLLLGGYLLQGVSALGGCLLPGVSALRGGVCSQGVSVPGRVSAPRGAGIPTCTEADTPPVDRITDACRNITLATTSLRPVITSFE